MQDFVVRELQQVAGVGLVEPQGAFYCLPVMTSFFGPSASAPGFGSIPEVDTLCRSALMQIGKRNNRNWCTDKLVPSLTLIRSLQRECLMLYLWLNVTLQSICCSSSAISWEAFRVCEGFLLLSKGGPNLALLPCHTLVGHLSAWSQCFAVRTLTTLLKMARIIWCRGACNHYP